MHDFSSPASSPIRNLVKIGFAGGYGLPGFGRYVFAPPNYSYEENMKRPSKTMTRTTKKKKTANVSKLVKDAVLKNATTYHSFVNDISGAVSNTHNTIYTLNLTGQITQGTATTNRQGDAVYLTSLTLKGMVASGTTAGAYQYRILVGWSPEEYSAATLGSGLGFNEIFFGSSMTSLTSSIVNPKAFQCILDQTIDINSQIAATSDLHNVTESLKLYTKFNYQQSGSLYGSSRNLYMVVIGSVLGGTSGVTGAGFTAISTDLVFKNL